MNESRKAIDEDEIRKIAKVLGVKLSGTEESTFASQINKILQDIAKLEEVDTEGVPTTKFRQDISYPKMENSCK